MNTGPSLVDDSLLALLSFLDRTPVKEARTWQDWKISPVLGGANNLIYRASGFHQDYAIKFTIRDERNRARREYTALTALQKAGMNLAPLPVLLDETRYRQPVVVQTWLEGVASSTPPVSDLDWHLLVEHYIQIHSLAYVSKLFEIEPSVFNFSSIANGKAQVYSNAARIPQIKWPSTMKGLLQRLEQWDAPAAPSPGLVLCRSDPNWRNLIRRSSDWASVDWENSGWGDAAFEIADLIAHPAYEKVTEQQLACFVNLYKEQTGDEEFASRVYTSYAILLAWWVVRFARYLYEMPLGLDQRLAAPAQGWLEDVQEKYHRYLQRALAHLE